MIYYSFDGTKIGLLCCIFNAFYDRRKPDGIFCSAYQYSVFDEIKEIVSDNEKAERVKKCIEKCKTKYASFDLDFAYLSGLENKYKIIFDYFYYVIKNKNIDVSENYAESSVAAFNELKQKIWFETHRFKGFIRFSETEKGYFYSHYEPDNDITALLMPHFTARFKNHAFIIHDTKRNILGLYDGEKSAVVENDRPITVFLSESEKSFTELWTTYYDSVNIKERKNEKLMKQYLPVRYWKNLPEKNRNKKSP